MWDNTTITMLLEGTRDTLYMTLVSTFFGYVLGLPLGSSSCSNRQRGEFIQMQLFTKYWM